jgi:hypothetical protein
MAFRYPDETCCEALLASLAASHDKHNLVVPLGEASSPTEGFSGAKELERCNVESDWTRIARRRSMQMIDIDSCKATANQMLQFNAQMPSEMIPVEIAVLRYRMVTELKAVCARLRFRSFTRFLAE